MYAVPARRSGQKIPLTPIPCLECGGKLFFSHDKVEGSSSFRYASCANLHSTFFTAPIENCTPIEADEMGYLIGDSTPGWEAQIPEWVRKSDGIFN